ncbi:hypothetical protein T4C_12378 [Trichinella pseudospiralis]|uniref:Uncharacterized protein n=1 Tax=Trichinella pseudospiralis TaxID=6337 RepID=A0A0V1JHF9_TRIPS|nr:hypothetical protein T4C_12378 [Trichinella pseudospiralis]
MKFSVSESSNCKLVQKLAPESERAHLPVDLVCGGRNGKLPYGDDCFMIVVTPDERKEYRFDEIRNQKASLVSKLLRRKELLNSDRGTIYKRLKKSKIKPLASSSLGEREWRSFYPQLQPPLTWKKGWWL